MIASSAVRDSVFDKSVVYICTHNAYGAMGFVINKQIHKFYFPDLMNHFKINIPMPPASFILHNGGPLEKIRGFVLHSSDYTERTTVKIDDNYAVSSSISVLSDIAFGNGPAYNLIALGYSSWMPKQLERELFENNWFITEATPELLFKVPDEEKWQYAVESLRFNIYDVCPRTGNA